MYKNRKVIHSPKRKREREKPPKVKTKGQLPLPPHTLSLFFPFPLAHNPYTKSKMRRIIKISKKQKKKKENFPTAWLVRALVHRLKLLQMQCLFSFFLSLSISPLI
jgi:hypothetical protein